MSAARIAASLRSTLGACMPGSLPKRAATTRWSRAGCHHARIAAEINLDSRRGQPGSEARQPQPQHHGRAAGEAAQGGGPGELGQARAQAAFGALGAGTGIGQGLEGADIAALQLVVGAQTGGTEGGRDRRSGNGTWRACASWAPEAAAAGTGRQGLFMICTQARTSANRCSPSRRTRCSGRRVVPRGGGLATRGRAGARFGPLPPASWAHDGIGGRHRATSGRRRRSVARNSDVAGSARARHEFCIAAGRVHRPRVRRLGASNHAVATARNDSHRLSGRRQDDAAQPHPRGQGGQEDRGDRQRVRRDRHRPSAGREVRRGNHRAQQWLPVLHCPRRPDPDRRRDLRALRQYRPSGDRDHGARRSRAGDPVVHGRRPHAVAPDPGRDRHRGRLPTRLDAAREPRGAGADCLRRRHPAQQDRPGERARRWTGSSAGCGR